MKKLSVALALLLASLLTAEEFSLEKAKRMDSFLARIAQRRPETLFLKKVTFTEDELNSYLNLIYTRKYTPEVAYILLELHRENEISGILKIKLEGKAYDSIPSFLRSVEVKFKGKAECSNYQMRLLFKDLIVNGTSFSPDVLDEVFQTAQINAKVKKSLFDWFSLMPGLKQLTIEEKKITCFY